MTFGQSYLLLLDLKTPLALFCLEIYLLPFDFDSLLNDLHTGLSEPFETRLHPNQTHLDRFTFAMTHPAYGCPFLGHPDKKNRRGGFFVPFKTRKEQKYIALICSLLSGSALYFLFFRTFQHDVVHYAHPFSVLNSPEFGSARFHLLGQRNASCFHDWRGDYLRRPSQSALIWYSRWET